MAPVSVLEDQYIPRACCLAYHSTSLSWGGSSDSYICSTIEGEKSPTARSVIDLFFASMLIKPAINVLDWWPFRSVIGEKR